MLRRFSSPEFRSMYTMGHIRHCGQNTVPNTDSNMLQLNRQKSDISYACFGMGWSLFINEPAFPLYCMSKISRDVYPTFSNITFILCCVVLAFYVFIALLCICGFSAVVSTAMIPQPPQRGIFW